MNNLRQKRSSAKVLFLGFDDRDNSTLATALHELEAQGYTVERIVASEAVLQSLFSEGADLLLVDANGPVNEILELAKSNTTPLPVIVLGDKASSDAESQILQAGASDFIPLEELTPSLLKRSVRYALEQAETKLALQVSEERHQAFIQNSSEGIWRLELRNPIPIDLPIEEQIQRVFSDSMLTEGNDVMARMYGFETADQLKEINMMDFFKQNEEANIYYLTAFINAGYQMRDAESIEMDNEGQTHYFLNNLIGIVEDGLFISAWGTQRDITELKREEIAQSQLATIVGSSNDGIYSTDTKGIIQTWNRGAEQIFGYSAAEASGQSLTMLVPPKYMDQKNAVLEQARRGEAVPQFETERLRKDGSLVDISLRVSPIFDLDGQVTGTSAIARDISERKQAERKAEYNATLYRALADNFPNGSVYLLDNEERFILAEGRGLALIGETRESVIGKKIGDVFQSEPLKSTLREAYGRALMGEEISVEVVVGDRIRILRAVSLPDDINGGPFVLAMTQDVTEQKQSEISLRESEALNRAVLNSMSAHVAVIDKDGRITAVNDSWRRFNRENNGSKETVSPNAEIGASYFDACNSAFGDSEEVARMAGDGIKSILSGERTTFSLEYPCPSPEEDRWFYMVVTPLETQSGGAVIAHMDISGRREAEESLRRSEERFRAFLENIPAVVFIKDADGHYVYLNKTVEELVHKPVNELLGKTVFDRMPFDYAIQLRRNCEKVMESGKAMEFEEVILDAEGQIHYQLVNKFPLIDTDGKQLVAGVAIDITARKLAEEALRASESRWRSLFDGDLIGHFSGDEDGRILEANNAFLNLLGYERSDLPLRWDDLTPPEWKIVDQRFAEGVQAGEIPQPYEKEFFRRDGSRVPVLLGASLISDMPGQSFCFVLDLTNRKQVEEALRKSENRFRTVVDSLAEGLIICDENGQLTHWNSTAMTMLGFTDDDEWLIDMNDFAEVFELSTLDGTILAFEEWPLPRILSGEKIRNYDLQIRRLDTDWSRIFSFGGAIVRDENNNLVLAFLTITDITKRQQAELELQASQGLLAGIIDSALDGIITIDAENRIIEFNPAAEQIFGYHRSEVIGRSISDTIIPSSFRRGNNGLTRYFETGIGPALNQRLELTATHANGSHFPIELSTTSISQDGKVVFAGFVRDITERKRAEAELHESRNRLSGVVESAMDAIITTDEQRRIVLFNPAAERMFGYLSENVAGQSIEILIPERFRVTQSSDMESFGAVSGLRSDGEEFPIEATVSQVQVDGHKLYTVILRDITERKLAEENLQRVNDELEVRVEQRTSELAQINKTLKGEIVERQTVMGALRETVVQLEMAKEESERANESLRANEARLLEGNRIFTELSRLRAARNEELQKAIQQITEAGSEMLDIERCSVWLFNGDHSKLECLDLFIRTTGEHAGGSVLNAGDFPVYFAALESGNTILADNARTHPATSEFWESYLKPLSITSMLDVAISVGGKTMGVLCCEQVENAHHWRLEDQTLARSAAAICSLALESYERARAEYELHQAKEDAELARESAEAARTEAERANNAKSEFLSRMSHELRTPMNSILGFAQIMEMSITDEKQTKRLAHIMKAGEHLLQLINEVLNLSHVESGHFTMSIEPVRIDSTMQTTIELIRPLCRQNNLNLIFRDRDTNVYVLADQQKLAQVLINLLSNATKYNRPSGEIYVEYEHRENDRLRINITDTGVGIPPEYMSKLFQPFERLQAAQSTIEGTGLGLALSKRLVEAMNGSMGAESTVGAGSTFWIELPKVPSPLIEVSKAKGEVAVSEQSENRHTILYVEDNLANLEVIKHLLENQPNIKLISAMQGQIGIDLAREHNPSLILLDLNLPDLGGEEVLKRLQLDDTTKDIPVVIVSADATPNQIKRLVSEGAVEYLTKPLDVRHFLYVVHRLLIQKDK